MHSLSDHVQVCWLNPPLLRKPETDGATPILLPKIRSPACRSRGIRTIGLAAFAPGETPAAVNTCCRYGSDWERWRTINDYSPTDGNEATLDLALDGLLKITSVTGSARNEDGNIFMLKCELTSGPSWGPHGESSLDPGESERPSPASPPPLVLAHLSGDTTLGARILRFHWRLQ